ncbi:MAG: PRC-barrel domain-containing protein [Atopobiaceae bacterium]|nr:PRC-barrel domain-containing protein [Atopobiaceae bacterium]MCI2173616.1 PRC-barrel domain-containing protein [Atopobiaceae bacterium]MCI2207742.1 PRC-barrel domain-containing protein [Atopobiaceae bacterium]
MNQLMGVRVYKPLPERKRLKKDGTERKPDKLGKVHNMVFTPDGRKLAGLMVKRPDVAGMVKREDLFMGIDSFEACDLGLMCTRGDDSFDDAARARLGLDWDRCIIWAGMDVVTPDGRELGYVTDISFDGKDGSVGIVYVTDGSISTGLVGAVEVPIDMVKGYDSHQRMVVANEAADLALSGGLAAKAGEGYAKMKIAGKEAGEKAGKKASEAVDKGSYALGRAMGKAKRAIEDATADDDAPMAEPVPAADVHVGAPAVMGEIRPPKGDPTSSTTTYVVDEVAKPAAVVDNGGNGKAAPKSSSPSSGNEAKKKQSQDVAKAIGHQFGKTRGMFSAFKKEFEENSK